MSNTFSIVVAGGRKFNNYGLLRQKLDALLSVKAVTHDIVIVSGTAAGADRLGERYAAERGYSVVQFPAQWDKFGKSAGYRRNEEMAENADAVVCFWDGTSRGTKHMIDIAGAKNLPTRVINY